MVHVFDMLAYASFSLGYITTKVANKLISIVLYFEMLVCDKFLSQAYSTNLAYKRVPTTLLTLVIFLTCMHMRVLALEIELQKLQTS